MSPQDNSSAGCVSCSRFFPVTVILVLGIVISVSIFLAAHAWEQKAIDREFRSLAEDRFQTITRTFEEFTRLLDFTDNVFMVGPPPDSPEFVGYVRSIKDFFERDVSHYSSVRGMVWIPRVPRDQQTDYEKAARAVFDPKYRIQGFDQTLEQKDGADRAESFPYYLGIPATPGHKRLGEDMTRDPAVNRALEVARDTGKAVAVAPIRISGQANDRFGYQIFQPLYANGAIDDAASRRRLLAGYLRVDLDVGTMINRAMAGIKPVGIEVILRDDTETPGVTLCRHESRLAAPPSVPKAPHIDPVALLPGDLQASMTTDLFGRKATLQCNTAPPFWVGRTKWEAWLLLCIGLILTLVVAGMQFNRACREAAVERTVAARMEALCKVPEPRS